MARVLWLTWTDPAITRSKRNFIDLCQLLGHTVDRLPGGPGEAIDLRVLRRKILDADALIIDDDAALQLPDVIDAVRVAVAGETRMLILGHWWALNAPHHPQAIGFVEHNFGVTLQSQRVHDLSGQFGQLVPARGVGFRDLFLDGIDEVVLGQATRLQLGSDAFELLVAPPSVLVTQQDRPVAIGPGEMVYLMAGWPVSDDADPRVVVVASAILPTTAPGDDLRKNLAFVERLIEWMTKARLGSQLARNAASAVLDLDLLIHEAIVAVLGDRFGDGWWSSTSRRLQLKAAERWIENGSVADVAQSTFCDFRDLIDIIDANWDVFKKWVDPDNRGKKRFADSAQPILDARNRVAHPIRARYAPLSLDDWEEVQRWRAMFTTVLSAALRERWDAEVRRRWLAEIQAADPGMVEERIQKAISSGFVIRHDGESLEVSNAYFRWCKVNARLYIALSEEEDRARLELTGPIFEEAPPPQPVLDDSPEKWEAFREALRTRAAPARFSDSQLENVQELFRRHAREGDILLTATLCVAKNLTVPVAHTLASAIAHAVGVTRV